MRKSQKDITPALGMPCTVGIGSDRYMGEVVQILSPKRIVVREKGGHEMKWSQRKDGNWRPMKASRNSGFYLYLGHAEEYLDPSF